MNWINTHIERLRLRPAQPGDAALVLSFIHKIARYEKMEDQVVATEATLHDSLFTRRVCECTLAYYEDKPVGFALYFSNFSTFIGRAGMYLEDLFVDPEMRGKGIGKALICFVAALARSRGCQRMEWSCLDWNQPSIAFYKSLGAAPMDEWTVYRLSGEDIGRVAEQIQLDPPLG